MAGEWDGLAGNDGLRRGREEGRFQRFTALWATSDTPTLQAQVREVRDRIDKLRSCSQVMSFRPRPEET